jgi:plasmid stabilization system protein ParE
VIRQTRATAAQVEALLDYHLARSRNEAARNLLRAVGEALDRIEADPSAGRPHLRPYAAIARWGYRWIKVHRYWFGYAVAQDCPVEPTRQRAQQLGLHAARRPARAGW